MKIIFFIFLGKCSRWKVPENWLDPTDLFRWVFVNSREDSFDVERFVDAVVEVLDGSDVHVAHEKFGGWHVVEDDVVGFTFSENVGLEIKMIIRNMKNKLDYDMISALNDGSPYRNEWSLVKCIKVHTWVDHMPSVIIYIICDYIPIGLKYLNWQ